MNSVHDAAQAVAETDGIGRLVVALDGPSGTGKSTVARGIAGALGLRYLDTGAMYRAATVSVLRAAPELAGLLAVGAAPDHAAAQRIVAIAESSQLEISTDPDAPWVRVNGDDVTQEIRLPAVTRSVSSVSATPGLRRQLVALQRRIIGAGGIVVEGRDIATVVWPNAEMQVYLTASAEARAARRAGELGSGADVKSVQSDLTRRDGFDSSRADSPLALAERAVTVDTSDLPVDAVIELLIDMTKKAASHV